MLLISSVVVCRIRGLAPEPEEMRVSRGKSICFAGDHELFVCGNDQAQQA
jgi:hypothetical protein